MDHLKEFNVNFGRLKLGKHEFNFQVTNKFFESFEQSLVDNCQIKVALTIDKTRLNLMKFNFKIGGSANFPCDRCNVELPYPMDNEFDILVKLNEEEGVENDEIVFLSPDAYEFNVAVLLYDFLTLSVPFKKDCLRKDHPDCIKIEELISYGNSSDNEEDDDDGDPRWNDLKKLL